MILSGGNFTQTPEARYLSSPLHEFWFDVVSPTKFLALSSSATTILSSTKDAVYETITGGTFLDDHQLNYFVYPRGKSETITISSSNPQIADVQNGNYLKAYTEGNVTVTYSSPTRTTTQNIVIGVTTPPSTTRFVGWEENSLARHISDSIDTLLSAHNPTTGKSIYSTRNHSSANYVYNPNCWAYGLSSLLTSNSPWNSGFNNGRGAGTLISPRHIAFATHYQLSTNSTLRYVKMDGTVVTRTMISKKSLPNYKAAYPDITIGLLDSDVPEGISFAKVLPQNISSYLPTLYAGSVNVPRIPAVFIDQEEKALIEDWFKDEFLHPLPYAPGYFIFVDRPTNATRAAYYENPVDGDSGSPVYVIINGEAVLLTVTTFNSGIGTSIRHNYSAINTVMSDLGGGYQLTDIDLSNFTIYT